MILIIIIISLKICISYPPKFYLQIPKNIESLYPFQFIENR